MPRLSEQSVARIYGLAASTAPTPGGGSVTALCGMLGIALILKSVRITLRRRQEPALTAAETALEQLAGALEADADADVAAFDAFIVAARRPRDAQEDPAEHASHLEAAAAGAAEAGLRALEHATEAIGEAGRIEDLIDRVVRADLDDGRRLLEVTRLNAIENAQGNLGGLGPTPAHTHLSARLASLAAD